MKERNDCLNTVRDIMLTKLRNEKTSNRKRYLSTVKDLILQSMIKLLEPSLMILCRKEDEGDIKGSLKEIEKKFQNYMKE